MVALGILAVLVGIGAPSLHTFIQNQQIRSSVDSLQAGFSLARSEALRRNERVSLWMVNDTSGACALDSGGAAWVVSLDDPAGACNASPSNTAVPRVVQIRTAGETGRTVSVAGVNASGTASSCITFNGFGRTETVCSSGALPLSQVRFSAATPSSSSRVLQLRVAAGGAVRLCDSSISDATNPSACQ